MKTMKNKIKEILEQHSFFRSVYENVFEDVAEQIIYEIKTYTEEDLRLAFGAGLMARDSYKIGTAQEVENEYIESLNPKAEEETVVFTYSFLRRKLEWEDFCDITGIDYYAKRNGYEIEDHETFEIKESVAKQYGLL